MTLGTLVGKRSHGHVNKNTAYIPTELRKAQK